MRKIITGFFIALLLTSVAFGGEFVNWGKVGEKFGVKVDIEKGWNLVPYPYIPGVEDASSEIKSSDILAVFLYVSEWKKYVEIYPTNRFSDEISERGLTSQWDDDNGGYLRNSAMWAYSAKKGKLVYEAYDAMMPLQYVQLHSGWNFVTITPEMAQVGSLQKVKGSCEFTESKHIYYWDSSSQSWDSKGGFIDLQFSDTMVGAGLLLKSTKDCTLGAAQAITAPPALPN